MEIRSTTEQDREVLADTPYAAFGRFPGSPDDGGTIWWSSLDMDRGVPATVSTIRSSANTAATC